MGQLTRSSKPETEAWISHDGDTVCECTAVVPTAMQLATCTVTSHAWHGTLDNAGPNTVGADKLACVAADIINCSAAGRCCLCAIALVTSQINSFAN